VKSNGEFQAGTETTIMIASMEKKKIEVKKRGEKKTNH